MSIEHIGSEHDPAEDIGIERGDLAGPVNAMLDDALLAAGPTPGPIATFGGFARSEAEEGAGTDDEAKSRRHWWGAAS